MEEPNSRNFHTGVEVWNTMVKIIIYIELFVNYHFQNTIQN